MKKRLFLLMLTLVSMCPIIYGADHEEVPFESNITLPLKGERIEWHERLDLEYANRLSAATMLAVAIPMCFIVGRYVPSLVERAMPRSLSTNSRLVKAVSLVAAFAAGLCAVSYLGDSISNISIDRIWQSTYAANLNATIPAHNKAVGNKHTGMITLDSNGNRVLRMSPHGRPYAEYPYPFDQWRVNREKAIREATSGLVNKFLLGPGNLQCISAINEKLNALDSQLPRVPSNIKGALRL